MQNTNKQGYALRKVTLSAIFLALAVVLSILTNFDIPIFGQSGMKVGFAGIFTTFPAILFGPLYGGFVAAFADFFRALIKPTGAFDIRFTLTAFVGGFLRGAIWLFVKRIKKTALKITSAAVIFLVGVAGALNAILLKADGISPAMFDGVADPKTIDTSGFSYIGKLVVSRAAITKNAAGNLQNYILYTTTALMVFAGIMLFLFLVDFIIVKVSKNEVYRNNGYQIALTVTLAGLVQTTINTIILRETYYPSWKTLSFVAVFIPRAIEEVLIRAIQAIVITLLYDVYVRRIKPNTFLRDS